LKVAAYSAVVMLGPSLATADWADSFDGGIVNQPWVFFNQAGASPPSYTLVDASASVLLFEGDPGQAAQGRFDEFAAGSVGLGASEYQFQNVRLRATVRSTLNANFQGGFTQGNNNTFLYVRSDPTLRSYLLAIDWADGSLDLERVNAGTTLTDLDDSATTDYSIDKLYTMELAALGTTLVGRLYDQGTLVAETKAIDATYSSGWSGLGSSINVNDALGLSRTLIAAEFDDVESISILPGDINIDGFVDRRDAALFMASYGQTSGSDWTTGDFDSDGRTSIADWALLTKSLATGGASPAAVPEPTSIALLGLCGGLLSLVVVRRRSRCRGD
jgi:hypothetical protein